MGKQKTYTIANHGLTACKIEVEVDESKGLPKIEIIGLPDTAIRESKERIRSSFKNSGLPLPPRRIVINLAPSHVRKVGTRFDLPIAVGVLNHLLGDTKTNLDKACYFGELGLNGEVKRVIGLLPSVISAYNQGIKKFVVPQDNIHELKYIGGIELYPVEHFRELIDFFQGSGIIKMIKGGEKIDIDKIQNNKSVLLSDIKGHEIPKRAITIAASGMHNILLIGPPGSGKSFLAKAIPSLLSPLNFSEILEISQIYSISGLLNEDMPLITRRPFRSVHHTASKVSIVGGGQNLTPGEVSLAHQGVLFFDELTEFPNQVLEVLRQPLEDGKVTISRVQGSVEYPADIMFVGAMNPCRCGFYKDKEKQCICSHFDVQKYQQKISGPLLDRFDMIIEVSREKISTIISNDKPIETDDLIYRSMEKARNIQNMRFKGTNIQMNSQISGKHFYKYIELGNEVKEFLRKYAEQYALSARVVHKLCKVARTIADLEGSTEILKSHIAEAVYYRGKTMFVGG